jgi:hypothetical protein
MRLLLPLDTGIRISNIGDQRGPSSPIRFAIAASALLAKTSVNIGDQSRPCSPIYDFAIGTALLVSIIRKYRWPKRPFCSPIMIRLRRCTPKSPLLTYTIWVARCAYLNSPRQRYSRIVNIGVTKDLSSPIRFAIAACTTGQYWAWNIGTKVAPCSHLSIWW